MGNGFTFELESLIFYAVACSCAEYLHIDVSDVSAYGDDVILPTSCREIFAEMLEFYGFVLNVKKSHSGSLFRESCGAHFYSGVDVKPIYLKDRVSSVPAVYRLANAIRRLAHRHNSRYGCDARFRVVFDRLVASVPRALRFRIPETLGDGGFIANLDEATPSRARYGIEGYQVKSVVEVNKTHYDETTGYLLAALWQLKAKGDLDFGFRKTLANIVLTCPERSRYERQLVLKATAMTTGNGQKAKMANKNSIPLNGRTQFRLAASLCQQWYDLGPWI